MQTKWANQKESFIKLVFCAKLRNWDKVNRLIDYNVL